MNLDSQSIGDTQLVTNSDNFISLKYFTQSKYITIQYDDAVAKYSPILTVRMTAVRMTGPLYNPYIYVPICGDMVFTINLDKDTNTYMMVEPPNLTEELSKFSYSDLLDLHDAITKVISNMPKRHWHLRDKLFPEIIRNSMIFGRVRSLVPRISALVDH